MTSAVCLYQLLLSILTSGPGVHHRVSGSRPQASPSPPLFRFPIGSYSPPLSDSGSSGPMQSVGAHKWSPPSIKRQSSGSPARRKMSSPARISPLAFTNPSALPTILGSPTKRVGSVESNLRLEDTIIEAVRNIWFLNLYFFKHIFYIRLTYLS